MNVPQNINELKSGFVALIGRPNVGKSTLLNKVVGEHLSIVSPKAQTTREHIRGILTEKDKGQIVFIDTPGIHKAREGGLNEFMVKSAEAALEGCDMIWYLIDPFSKFEHEEIVLNLIQSKDIPLFIILNKVDLLKTKESFERTQEMINKIKSCISEENLKQTYFFELSVLKNHGCQSLLDQTWSLLKQGPFYYPESDNLSDRPTKFFVSEIIRKKIYDFFEDEVPYSCMVHICSYQDKKNGHTHIEAHVIVERESQKGILIGQGGRSIKKLGESSRREIEKFIERKVYLDLKVKVIKDWTQDSKVLTQYGYTL